MTSARTVTSQSRRTLILVQDFAQNVPAAFALLGSNARDKVALRITGGCSGMSESDKSDMLRFFELGMRGFAGVCWSGGTRAINQDGSINLMVTEVPGVIASSNPDCVALGTAPRTDIMSLRGESHLVFDENGATLNPSHEAILIVQDGADGRLGWDGDLRAYTQLMEQWKTYARFSALGVIAWNGGSVTKKEIINSAEHGWSTILVAGSGRAADEMIADSNFISQSNVFIVHKDDPQNLRATLINLGFIKE
ncbi:TPA: hypothetical protein DF272_06565 [Candidatus Falkowbacteria bacterium]|nr:hypothetical protein [Candidatus Falkowbacteria bacterium]